MQMEECNYVYILACFHIFFKIIHSIAFKEKLISGYIVA